MGLVKKWKEWYISDKPVNNGSYFMLVLFIFLQILVNFDSGAISAATTQFQDKPFNLSDTEVGLLSSLVYVGLSISSTIGGAALQKGNQKWIIFGSLVLNILSNAVFAWAREKSVLLTSRVFVGFSQAVMVIYAPVWVDEFAPSHRCTLWMSIVQGGVSIGVVLGYSVTGLMIAYLKEVHPTDPFKLQVLLLCAPVLAFFFVPGRYINVNKRKSPKHNDGDDHDNDLSYDYSDHTEEMEGPSERSPLLANIAEESTSTLTDSGDDDENVSSSPRFDVITISSSLNKGLRKALSLFKRPIYLCTVFSLSALYFVVSSILLWMTDYLTEYIGVPKSQVVYAFGVTSATAPFSGVIFGGWITDKIGGYKGPEGVRDTARLASMLGLLSVAFALPVIWFHEFVPIITFIWFLLFFGAGILPPATGILMSCVPRSLRSFSSSFSAVIYNWLGYFSGPFVAGLISDLTGNKAWGMRVTLGWSAFGAFFMCCTWFFAHRKCQKYYRRLADAEDWDDFEIIPDREELEYEIFRAQRPMGVTLSGLTRTNTGDVRLRGAGKRSRANSPGAVSVPSSYRTIPHPEITRSAGSSLPTVNNFSPAQNICSSLPAHSSTLASDDDLSFNDVQSK